MTTFATTPGSPARRQTLSESVWRRAQSFTIQLNSNTAEKTSANAERFQVNLNPAIDVPYLAQPRVQLTSIAFANSFVNIAESLGNNRISFQLAYTQTTQDELTQYNLDAELSD